MTAEQLRNAPGPLLAISSTVLAPARSGQIAARDHAASGIILRIGGWLIWGCCRRIGILSRRMGSGPEANDTAYHGSRQGDGYCQYFCAASVNHAYSGKRKVSCALLPVASITTSPHWHCQLADRRPQSPMCEPALNNGRPA